MINDANLEALCVIAAILETSTPFWGGSELSQSFALVTVLQQGLLKTLQSNWFASQFLHNN